MAEIECGTSDLVTKYAGQDQSLNMTADSLSECSLGLAKPVRAIESAIPCPGSEEWREWKTKDTQNALVGFILSDGFRSRASLKGMPSRQPREGSSLWADS